MKKKLIWIIFITILLILLVAVAYRAFDSRKRKTKKNISVEKKIIETINDESRPKTKTELIDKVREFVFENSVKTLDSKLYEYAWKKTYVLEKLYLSKYSDERLQLTCGPRALAMKAILDVAGIRSRIVHLFSDDFTQLKTHTLLEVFNPETQRWEIQDPDSNSNYINKEAKRRASIAELILDNNNDNFAVVGDKKEKGWQQKIKNHYFEGAMYNFEWDQRSKSIVIYNPKSLSTEKKFPDEENLTFFEILEKEYKNPAIILNLNNSIEFESIFYDFR